MNVASASCILPCARRLPVMFDGLRTNPFALRTNVNVFVDCVALDGTNGMNTLTRSGLVFMVIVIAAVDDMLLTP